MSVLSEIDQNSLTSSIEKESDDLFFDLIKERPCLYNKQLPEHHDKIVLENAMEDIAFIMQDTVENCELRWKKFQSLYQREKMLEEKENRIGSAASRRQKWPFYEKMKSLYSCNSYRNSYTNLDKSRNDGKISTAQPIPVCQRRIKKKNDETMVVSAFNNVHSQLNSVVQLLQAQSVPKASEENSKKDDDCNALISKIITARLNELSPSSAKAKRKQILQCLIDDDSDE